MTDDTGNLTSGTIVDEAFVDAILDEIDDQAHSATNPTIKPKAITDEVVTARGSLGALDTRLDVSLNEDGTLKTQASLVTATQAGGLPPSNVVLNDTFIIWSAGDAAAADGWTLAGAGAAVARAGTGLGDTTRKVGDFCSKLTYGAATLTYYIDILPTAAYSRLDHLDGEIVGFGAWVWASAASQTRLYIADGATTTYSDSYHTGGSAWEWLSGTHTISGSATYLRFGIAVESGAVNPAFLSGPTVLLGEIAPANWRPTPNIESVLAFDRAGTQGVDTNVNRYVFARMAIIKDVQMYAKTAPTGAALIIDLNNNANTAFTTKPQIDATDNGGSQTPDGTYQYRCFSGETADAPGQLLTMDIDQIGSTLPGSDVTVMIRFLEFIDPFESVKAAS
jgi:hypothetical protein